MSTVVRVENATRGTVVAEEARVATSLRDRTVGLLGTRELPRGTGLLIQRSPSIHMFFMRYAIDAVFIDKDLRIAMIAANLKPWHVVWWARGARDCLEVPCGTALDTSTMVGDELRLIEIGP